MMDTNTKYRQEAFISIVPISLLLSMLLYFSCTKWLSPGLISYAVLGVLVYWGNKQVYFVPYRKNSDTSR